MTLESAPNIQFSEILFDLIAGSPYRRNRRAICDAVGISPAALSQYARGHNYPRLEQLVLLAKFFGVTLDYLVLGKESPVQTFDRGQIYSSRYVDWALGNVQSKMGHHSWLTSRVGQLLLDHIAESTERARSVPTGGMLLNDEVLELERISLETHILTVDLKDDMLETDSGNSTAGLFGSVVSENLCASAPRPYRFLLASEDKHTAVQHGRTFLNILHRDLGVPRERLQFCEFRTTAYPVIAGTCLYRLDVDAMRSRFPSLSLMLENYLAPGGWLGYAINSNSDSNLQMLHERRFLPGAIAVMKRLWDEASPLSFP